MRASAVVSWCVEAVVTDSPDGNPITNGWSTCTNRLERGEKRSGHDVTSARGWMEHLEQECGAGAYTVLRCDAIYDGSECSWRVWGLEFHLDRLCSSYGALRGIADWEKCSVEEEANAQTNDIITALLREAELAMRDSAEASTDESTTQDAKGEVLAWTLMLTVLLTPPEIGNKRSIRKSTIRGHAAFIGGASPAQNGPEDAMSTPISACLGIPSDITPEALTLLPRRYSDDGRGTPGAKVSSWCRERRPLEDGRFKPPGSGVGEVLLVRQCKAPTNNENDGDFLDSLEILEGLTSNLFVIYKDGTVRTAPAEKVLSGYARQLVVDELNDHKNLTLDVVNAPTIEDARNGLWSEVFITSSIRLIVPVNHVVIPPIDGLKSATLWQSESNSFPLTRSLWTAVRERGYHAAERR